MGCASVMSALPCGVLLDRRAGTRVSSLGVAHGQVAQLVEQGTENPRVGGSSPSLATIQIPKGRAERLGPLCCLAGDLSVALARTRSSHPLPLCGRSALPTEHFHQLSCHIRVLR